MRWLALTLALASAACSAEEPAAEEALPNEEWPPALDEDGRIVRWYARDG